MENIEILIAIITIALTIIGLILGYWQVKRVKTDLEVDVKGCSHCIRSDGNAFLLGLDFQAHNVGNKNTTLTGIDLSFIDANGMTRHQKQNLNVDIDAGKSSATIDGIFSFTPPFPYADSFQCNFVLYYTSGEIPIQFCSTKSQLTNLGKLPYIII